MKAIQLLPIFLVLSVLVISGCAQQGSPPASSQAITPTQAAPTSPAKTAQPTSAQTPDSSIISEETSACGSSQAFLSTDLLKTADQPDLSKCTEIDKKVDGIRYIGWCCPF